MERRWTERIRSGFAALLALGVVLLFARCDLTEPVDTAEIAVEAFVQTGRPLPAVTVRRLQGLGDTSRAPAQNAEVTLRLGDQTYAYEEAHPGRYEPMTAGVVVPPRTSFELAVTWNGERARARGTTPPAIEIAEVCLDVPDEPVQAVLVDSLRRDSLDIPAEEGFLYPIEVTTRWSTAGLLLPSDTSPNGLRRDTSTWVRAELQPSATFSSTVVNFFLQPAEVRRELRYARPSDGDGRTWTGVYAYPVESADAPLPRHRVTASLVRGDTSFAEFATSRTDPDRREPVSNVTGGVGIATGIALDSLGRVVERGVPRCVPTASAATE